MPGVPDYQHVLLRKATQDLLAAQTLAASDLIEYDPVGFHCQQAAEKAVRAVLETQRVEYPLTHDLAVLLALLGAVGPACPLGEVDARALNPYAVRFRYEDGPGEEPPAARAGRDEALDLAARAVAWATSIVDRG